MLKNTRLAGKKIITQFGRVEYDEEGITTGLTKEQEEVYKGIPGYEVLEDSFQSEDTKVEEEPKKEPVKEKKSYSKTALENKTVAELEKLAKKEFDTELAEGIKKEKIQEILGIQQREG